MTAFPVAEDRFILRYTGNPGMTSQVIRQHLLYRAAELTLRRGYAYFTFQDSRAVESDLASTPLFGRGEAVGIPQSPVHKGDLLDPCGPEAEHGGGFTTLYSTTAVVRMLESPTSVPRALDARRIVEEFRARNGQVERLEP